MVNSSKQKAHRSATSQKTSSVAHETEDHEVEEKTKDSTNPIGIERQKEEQNKKSSGAASVSWIWFLFSGSVGGVITLGLWIWIQWAGFLPSFSTNPHGKEAQVSQVTEIEQKLFKQSKMIEELYQYIRAFAKRAEDVAQELETLKADFYSSPSKRIETLPEDGATQEEGKNNFSDLENKVDVLKKNVQFLLGVSQDIDKFLLIEQSNKNDLIVLKQQLNNIRKEINAKNDKKDEVSTAAYIAVSALKNAVDRGGSYVNELETLQHILPSIPELDLLKKTASMGLPNSAKLSADFAKVADAIVRTQDTVAADASVSERVRAWVKSLVTLRKTGDVEGMTLSAITARMEVAIQAGDYERALAEWTMLPQKAKDTSINFIHVLEQNLAVHRVLQKLLLSIQQDTSRIVG